MSNYKDIILSLNYCLFSSLTKTIIYRDDCIVALNVTNVNHQQSNLCFRIRLLNIQDLPRLLQETKELFEQAGCIPRYFIDELVTPSLRDIHQQLEMLNYRVDIDSDIIMSWKRPKDDNYGNHSMVKLAAKNQLADLVRVFGAAYGYGQCEWLQSKIQTQLDNPKVFPIFYLEEKDKMVCAVILHTPPGLPHLGHINAIATHPDHQRKGYAAICLKEALIRACQPHQTFYLEVYDDLYHAHRLYERIGFKNEGTLQSISFTTA